MLTCRKLHRLLALEDEPQSWISWKGGCLPPCLFHAAPSNPQCAECLVLLCAIHLTLCHTDSLEPHVPARAFTTGFQFQCPHFQDWREFGTTVIISQNLLCQFGIIDEQGNSNKISCKIQHFQLLCFPEKNLYSMLNRCLRLIDDSVK